MKKLVPSIGASRGHRLLLRCIDVAAAQAAKVEVVAAFAHRADVVVVVAVAAADKIGDEAELAAVTRDYYLSVAPCFVGS